MVVVGIDVFGIVGIFTSKLNSLINKQNYMLETIKIVLGIIAGANLMLSLCILRTKEKDVYDTGVAFQTFTVGFLIPIIILFLI